MKANAFALAGLAGSFVLAGSATAAFVGVSLEEYVGTGWSANGYDATGLTTYRMYADFDGAGDDGVLSVFGLPGMPLSWNSTNGFHNDVLGGLTAPLNLTGAGIWANQWDTYVTIGATQSTGDATGVSPGFGDITGNLGMDWVIDNGGWFVTPDDAQSQAVDNRVLLGQIVVPGADGAGVVSGTVNLLLRDGASLDGIAFSSMPAPAPGALALLGLAGIAGTRRRRG